MERKNIPIKYTSRDFATIKQDLIEYAKRYYPDTYRDFNEAGFGSLMLDWTALLGDTLSFYLDYQANESFFLNAQEYENIIKLGKQQGYRFRGNPSSFGTVTFFIIVPSNTNGEGPDRSYLPILKKGSEFESDSGVGFILNEDVFFANPYNEIVVARVNDSTGIPTAFAVKSYGQVISGRISRQLIEVDSFRKFRRIELDAQDIAEILSVVDSEGHDYYEVDYLSQNVIYRPILNRDTSTNEQAPNFVRPFIVPRRFVVERERRKTYLQFGYGTDSETTESSVADPSNILLRVFGKEYISDESIDPNNFISTDKFGVAPANTILEVVYRRNTIDDVNVSVNRLRVVTNPKFVFEDIQNLTSDKIGGVVASLELTNEEGITGDVSLPNTEELKRRILDTFAAQNRAVTSRDYESAVYTMPPKFGAIKRVKVVRDMDSLKRNLNMYVISEDNDGSLTQTNEVVKQNLKFWLMKNKMINDTVDILDARVINLGINFEIIGNLEKNKYDVLNNAVLVLRKEMKKKRDIGQSFFITDVYNVLRKLDDVVDVVSVTVEKKAGGDYTDNYFNVESNTSADGRYIACPLNAIFEIRFPSSDIFGSIS